MRVHSDINPFSISDSKSDYGEKHNTRGYNICRTLVIPELIYSQIGKSVTFLCQFKGEESNFGKKF